MNYCSIKYVPLLNNGTCGSSSNRIAQSAPRRVTGGPYCNPRVFIYQVCIRNTNQSDFLLFLCFRWLIFENLFMYSYTILFQKSFALFEMYASFHNKSRKHPTASWKCRSGFTGEPLIPAALHQSGLLGKCGFSICPRHGPTLNLKLNFHRFWACGYFMPWICTEIFAAEFLWVFLQFVNEMF